MLRDLSLSVAVSTPLASTAVVSCLVGGLPLSVLLALHPPVLEPDLDLSLSEVEVPRQFPSEMEII